MSLTVQIYSFSYHLHGIPEDTSDHHGGFVFDCRCLPNPGREERFASLTGKDDEVKRFLSNEVEAQAFLKSVFELVDLAIRNYLAREFQHLMVSFGCTGGQHRSVFCAEQLAQHLLPKAWIPRSREIQVEVIHTRLSS